MVPSTHLLIVDDEVAFADALADFMRYEGFSVSTAYALVEARAAIRARESNALRRSKERYTLRLDLFLLLIVVMFKSIAKFF